MIPIASFLVGAVLASFFSLIASLEMLEQAEKARSLLWKGHFENFAYVSICTLVVAVLLFLALAYQPTLQ